ncbi:MAG: glycerol kinase GlpK [Candidatus Bathyarchaeia archaeon]|nr:glycerol kinase GlpK [Candidatus Bathyarchaeota archaeon]
MKSGGRFVLAVDQGTTGTRAMLFDDSGFPVRGGWAYMEHRQIYPRPGWVEHDPIEIWENTKAVFRAVIEGAGIDIHDLVGIGVTNQRETVVVWDVRSGLPLYNAIVWQCRRTSSLVDYLRANYMDLIVNRTGLIPDPYFSATKIWWLLDNIPDLRVKVEKGEAVFGTIDTWIIWNMTRGSRDCLTPDMGGAYITDYSNASRTMLFDIHRLDWDMDLLEIMGSIPVHALPTPRPSCDREFYGYTSSEFSRILGGVEIPVAGDAGDQQAALFGQVGFEVGDIKCTYGTGNFILMNTGSRPIKSKHGLISTIFHSLEKGRATYACEGSIFVTGAAIQWLRDGLKMIESPSEASILAESVDDTGGVYFVPAFVGLGAPYWDMYARGLIIGLTRGTDRRHIARAILESIAYLTRDVIEAIHNDTGIDIRILRVDGGVSRSDFLMQFQADILGIDVVRPIVSETTSLGAAYLAGLAVGLWRDLDDVKSNWRIEKVFKPRMDEDYREKLYRGWRSAVRRALDWAREIPWVYELGG